MPLGLGVLVVVGLALSANPAALARSLRGFDVRLLIPVLSLSLLNYALRFVRWEVVPEHPYHPVNTSDRRDPDFLSYDLTTQLAGGPLRWTGAGGAAAVPPAAAGCTVTRVAAIFVAFIPWAPKPTVPRTRTFSPLAIALAGIAPGPLR